jgi:hypothetical protein
MLIQEHCDEHRMRKHKECNMLIAGDQRKKTINNVLDA